MMKFAQLLTLTILTLFCSAAGATAEEDASVVSLTLTQSDYNGGRIYLPVRIENVAGTMRLDTGASSTRITLAPWNKSLPVIGQSMSAGATGKATSCDDVEAKILQLQAASGNNIGRSKYVVTRCAANDGDDLLGLDFFKGAHFAIDFTRRQMIFSTPSQLNAQAKAFRPIAAGKGLVGIDLRAGGVAASGLFDSGAEISAVDQKFVDSHKGLFTLVKKKGKASEAGGRMWSSRIYKIKDIDLGDKRILRGLYVLAYDFGALRDVLGPQTPFILGYNFISKFNWDLDFRTPNAPTWDARPR
mgnify:CR=1 FL=1